MNAKLATNSGWKTDHSDAVSVTDLVASGDRVSLVIIPQATLAGKLKMGDKYLKYHRQVSKDRGCELYWNFISEIEKFFAHDSIIYQEEIQSKNQISLRDGKISITWGSYEKRQGFEFMSTGPSTHYFQY